MDDAMGSHTLFLGHQKWISIGKHSNNWPEQNEGEPLRSGRRKGPAHFVLLLQTPAGHG
jgi:hypothetical protein